MSFINGFKNDLHNIGKITKKNNIYFLVDACLNTGYGNIDVQKCNIDFLVASNYKWLMSGFGAAEFYCKKKHIDKLIIKDLKNLFAKDVLELLKLKRIKESIIIMKKLKLKKEQRRKIYNQYKKIK